MVNFGDWYNKNLFKKLVAIFVSIDQIIGFTIKWFGYWIVGQYIRAKSFLIEWKKITPNILIIFILANCTSELQPKNVIFQQSLKHVFKVQLGANGIRGTVNNV